ncbi:MAG: ferric reductase-like transmembrane domain-containing protein, partial [Cyanobacteria bacterium J06639_18]
MGAFVLSLAHTIHKVEHSFEWNLEAVSFFTIEYQWGILAGFIALLLMAPAAFTSFDSLQKYLGHWWRKIHLLSVPSAILSVFHA